MPRAIGAYEGSIDAALSLMGKVLPGWVIERMKSRRGNIWEAHLWQLDNSGWHEDGCHKIEVWHDSLSRALLLAIINALIWKQENDSE